MDRARMVAIVAERLKVRLDEDDPAFVLVELNRLALEETAAAVVDELAEFRDQIIGAASTTTATDARWRRGQWRTRCMRNLPAAVWISLTLIVASALLAAGVGAGYWAAGAARDHEALRAKRALESPEGRAAVQLAEFGQARLLLDCAQTGWTQREGYCYGTAKEGRITGWRIR